MQHSRHYCLGVGEKRVGVKWKAKLERASIKRPITCPDSTFDYLMVLSMPQVFLNSCKSLHFHGGDTGSIPVRDATVINSAGMLLLREVP